MLFLKKFCTHTLGHFISFKPHPINIVVMKCSRRFATPFTRVWQEKKLAHVVLSSFQVLQIQVCDCNLLRLKKSIWPGLSKDAGLLLSNSDSMRENIFPYEIQSACFSFHLTLLSGHIAAATCYCLKRIQHYYDESTVALIDLNVFDGRHS